MDAITVVREQLAQTRDFLADAMPDVTADQAHWQPPGKSNPIGATYAHVVLGEDGFVNGIIRKSAPLFATTWAGRTGVDTPPPDGFDWSDWGRDVRIELPAVREYAHAVALSTDEWLASLSPTDLATQFDFSDVGLGHRTLAWILGSGVVGHVAAHWGEICCLKGLQGGKGFPF